MRQVIKLINKEWENLEMTKERHNRLKQASGEPILEDGTAGRYADKLAQEAIQSSRNNSGANTPETKQRRNMVQ